MATDGSVAYLDDERDREPKSSRGWLAIIEDAERYFKDYHSRADNIDKRFADSHALASTSRDREMQMFWANIAVLGPSIYSRPPVPVVVPRFRDRRPIPRVTSELLERATIVAFEQESIDSVMRMMRDDLVVQGRGCAWIRYDTTDGERVCIEHINRRDFLHEPARSWKEVGWVARAAYLTKEEMKERFEGDAWEHAAYNDRKDHTEEKGYGPQKAKVWEIWSKTENEVVWVVEGHDKVLDSDKPHLKLADFFPCPQPAYGTVERGTLVPVPDYVFYKDQIEEINVLTARISALTEALKLRGFYPAGSGEIGDAIEAAIKATSDTVVLIPVSNWSLLGNGSAKDMIVWLPLEIVVAAISQMVELRRQLIDDVYQITGLSDIMRGSTEAQETLGAQQLKSQYGSIRIRDRQDALIRVARDITRIVAEIMAENFEKKTLLDMSQMEIETDAEIREQIKPLKDQIRQIESQIKKAQTDPNLMAQAQQNPEQANQLIAQATGQINQLNEQIEELEEKPTQEKIMKFLRDQRIRPFVLDIETDSTIAPDENATKQRATEFITAVGGFMGQALPLVQAMPQAAPVSAEFLKFLAGQFRGGREMEGKIEEFAEQMVLMSKQQQGPDPAQLQAQADAQAAQQKAQQDAQAQKFNQDERLAAFDLKQRELKAADEREATRLDYDMKCKAEQHRLTVEAMAEKRANDAALHAKAMEQKALEVEATHAKIAQTQVAADAASAKAQPAAATESNDGMEQAAKAMEQVAALMAQAALAPKRIVRDPKTNAIVGIETIAS